MLLARDASTVALPSVHGASPLHEAVGNSEMLRTLLAAAGDVRTAHSALWRGVLLEAAWQVHVRGGPTPLHMRLLLTTP